MDNKGKRDQFTSGFGFVLASAGSAIGLGNIWRFPYMTGTNGGGAFVLLYLAIVILVGATLLLVEFTIGRHGQANAVASYGKISKPFKWIGYLGVFTSFPLLAYYSVVGGWTIYYSAQSALGKLTSVPADQMGAFFGGFIGLVTSPIIYLAIFLIFTLLIVAKGISGGIEKWSKILMPAMFVLLVILLVRAVTLPGAMEGVRWYLKPDFSKINGSVVVAALGQAFFSLSVGLSGMVTYGSYLSKKENLTTNTLTVVGFDTLIAILAGFVVFPAVFAFSMEPGGGPGLVFITLPQVFSKMPMGAFFSASFFLLLLFAALTSSISIMEVSISYFTESFQVSRRQMSWIYGIIVFALAIPVSLSFGIWGDVSILGKGIFDLYDYFCANLALPFCAFMCAILVGWVWGKDKAMAELTNNGTIDNWYIRIWFPLVKYVSPLVVGLILLNAIGVLKF